MTGKKTLYRTFFPATFFVTILYFTLKNIKSQQTYPLFKKFFALQSKIESSLHFEKNKISSCSSLQITV